MRIIAAARGHRARELLAEPPLAGGKKRGGKKGASEVSVQTDRQTDRGRDRAERQRDTGGCVLEKMHTQPHKWTGRQTQKGTQKGTLSLKAEQAEQAEPEASAARLQRGPYLQMRRRLGGQREGRPGASIEKAHEKDPVAVLDVSNRTT